MRTSLRHPGRARELDGAGGFYALQAAIIACHARADTAGDTDWPLISALYAELAAVPVDRLVPLPGKTRLFRVRSELHQNEHNLLMSPQPRPVTVTQHVPA